MFKNFIKNLFKTLGYKIESLSPYDFPYNRSLDRNGIEVLGNLLFQNSCELIGDNSLLDTSRLANLWQICRLTDQNGAIMEIGTYRGGGALHLSNSCPGRKVIICDPFSEDSFDALDEVLDVNFSKGMFNGYSVEHIDSLFKGRNFEVIPGYFPHSIKHKLPSISFVHLDVDVYSATKEILHYLLTNNVLMDRSLILLDDYKRSAKGVDRAVEEVLNEVGGAIAVPLFPGQGLIIPSTWFQN